MLPLLPGNATAIYRYISFEEYGVLAHPDCKPTNAMTSIASSNCMSTMIYFSEVYLVSCQNHADSNIGHKGSFTASYDKPK